MSIKVQQLTRKYGNQIAVNGISFEIPTGQVVGFLGPNGAGKSTTMKILTGFITPTEGKAFVSGFDVEQQPQQTKANIGYLPEHNPLYLDMFVREYLIFSGHLCGLKKNIGSKVDEMIKVTGLTLEKTKKIGALSKGYRQRVGLAQALLHDPKVLILDEPTSGLDPNQVTEIRKIIRDIGHDRTVLLSTHIMQEVEAMCDRVIIINKGNIVADDTVRNLQRTQTNQVLFIRFKKPVGMNKLQEVPGIDKVDATGNDSFRLYTNDIVSLQEKLFAFAVEAGNVILEQREEAQSLEHVFRAYTNN